MSSGAPAATTAAIEPRLDVTFPSDAAHDQDEEWCELRRDGEVRQIRFHDYAEVFAIPGLYERLFHEKLECDSPRTVCGARLRRHPAAQHRYQHRLATDGEPIHYVAMIARKRGDLPPAG